MGLKPAFMPDQEAPVLRGVISRQGFLKTAVAALLALTVSHGRTDSGAGPGRARLPSKAACCYGPRALGRAMAPDTTPAPTSAISSAAPNAVADIPTPTPTPVPDVSTPAPAPVASSWMAAPTPAPQPPPPSSPESRELALVREAETRFGIRLMLEGQDWGPDEANRLANLGAAIDAFGRLPAQVRSAIGPAHPHGPLHFLSNSHGRTLLGWQPYGDFPIGFYTNSDRDQGGSLAPANQVVLIPGFSDISIGHELLHAYQFRAAPPGRYGLAIIGAEMKSFMNAVGWRQIGSDQEITEAAAADATWQEFNALFVYEGRQLTYLTSAGTMTTLTPPNPLEAYAVAGSFYYTRPADLALPDWPEYWMWFQANLG